jgi:hypothetical protein
VGHRPLPLSWVNINTQKIFLEYRTVVDATFCLNGLSVKGKRGMKMRLT